MVEFSVLVNSDKIQPSLNKRTTNLKERFPSRSQNLTQTKIKDVTERNEAETKINLRKNTGLIDKQQKDSIAPPKSSPCSK